jgi:hypothetical protein
MEGIPVPIPFILGDTAFAHFLMKINTWLIRISRGLFSYQIAAVVRPKPTLDVLLANAKKQGKAELQKALDDHKTQSGN